MRYGLLTETVPGQTGKYRSVRCDCGTEKDVRIDHLRGGKVISCGCEAARRASARAHRMHEANTTHGKSRSRVHNAWLGMKQRCENANHRFYSYYGGRGITVCERWQDFENFLADMGEPGEGETLDRVDNNRGYEPGNCRWASRREQMNNRRVNRTITWKGVTATVAEWSALTGIHYNTIAKRLDAGRPPDEILSYDNFHGEWHSAKTHCKHGHPFDEANTYVHARGRTCRACHNARQRERMAAKRAAASSSPAA